MENYKTEKDSWKDETFPGTGPAHLPPGPVEKRVSQTRAPVPDSRAESYGWWFAFGEVSNSTVYE